MGMTHKERVLKSLSHEEPDRIPFMYRDVPEVRSRLKKDLNLDTDEELFQHLDIDFRWVEPEYTGPDILLSDGHRKDIWGVEWKYTRFSESAGYWNEVFHPLINVVDPKVLADYPWPSTVDWDFSKLESICNQYADYAIMTAPGMASPGVFQYPIQTLIGVERSFTDPLMNPVFFEKLIEKVLTFQLSFIDKMFASAKGKIDFFRYSNIRKELEEWKDFSLIATGASIFQHPTFVRGTDKLMMDMMMSPDIANYLFSKFFNFYFEYYRRMFEEAGDLIDIFALADDFGMQNTLLISPEMFEEYVAPRLKKMVGLAHHYDIKFLLHTCGNVEVIIPRFIDLGVDILDPLQPECMDPVEIKNKYGKYICLRGGISVQNIVSKGTVEEVKIESKRIVEALMKGGGYIFAPGHPVLQDDIPVENILAMYETGYKFGCY